MSQYWNISGTKAQLSTAFLAGEVDVAHPDGGFLPRDWLTPAALLRVLAGATSNRPEVVADCYQRQTDLVAIYSQSAERDFRPEIYWRYLENRIGNMVVAGLELIVSAQTSLLDSQPKTQVETRLPAGEFLRLSAEELTLVLFRPREASVSYCEMIQPEESAGCDLKGGPDASQVRWQLFADRLEKGVIRRARLRGMFLPRNGDEALARAGYEAFLASPLVLST